MSWDRGSATCRIAVAARHDIKYFQVFLKTCVTLHKKMKFSIKYFFSKYGHIRKNPYWTTSEILNGKKSLIEILNNGKPYFFVQYYLQIWNSQGKLYHICFQRNFQRFNDRYFPEHLCNAGYLQSSRITLRQ